MGIIYNARAKARPHDLLQYSRRHGPDNEFRDRNQLIVRRLRRLPILRLGTVLIRASHQLEVGPFPVDALVIDAVQDGLKEVRAGKIGPPQHCV